MKIILALLLIAILIALGSGLYFLYQDKGDRQRTLDSLIIRIALAILLIILLIISVWMGWIHPHPVGR
jgi:succinate dehydrogenase/fumarate reductase cytochrome b subunit